jgi:hypothetical protein
MQVLIVRSPFAGKGVGERIADPQEIAAILGSEAAAHVVPVVEPDAPAKPRKE